MTLHRIGFIGMGGKYNCTKLHIGQYNSRFNVKGEEGEVREAGGSRGV